MNTLLEIDNRKIPLSVPFIANYLKKGYSQSRIAEICNVSRQAVNSYIQTHWNELGPLTEDDMYQALRYKHVSLQATEKISELLDDCERKELIALNAIMGTAADKYRLFTGQSTQNVSVQISDAERESLVELTQTFASRMIAQEQAKYGQDTQDIVVKGDNALHNPDNALHNTDSIQDNLD